MMKSLILLIILLFLTSCQENKSPTEEHKRNYKEILSLYPNFLVAHFPQDLDLPQGLHWGFSDLLFPRGRYLSYIHLAIVCDDQLYVDSLEKRLSIDSKEILNFKDTCLFIPYDYRTFEIIKEDSVKNRRLNGKYPVPNFRRWHYQFVPEFYEGTIYLLDARKGYFLPDSCLSRYGVGLSKDWNHGYTRGVTIMKKGIVYWLEVW